MLIWSVKVQTAPVPGWQNEVVSHMRCRTGRGGGDRATVRASNAAEFVKLAFEFPGPGGVARDDRDLGRLRPGGLPRGPTPGQEHPENRDPPDLGPRNPREPRAVSIT